MDDYRYMELALKEAKKAYDSNEVPVGAIIVRNGKILAKAFNMKEKKKCSLEHAELIAIKKACGKIGNWRLIDSTMYVTLEPCPMCASAIKQSRIKRVVYLLDNNSVETSEITNRIYSLKDANKPVEKVKLDISKFDIDSMEILSNFFKNKRY